MKESVLKPHIPFKSPELKDEELVIETLLDCLKYGYEEDYFNVLISHLMTLKQIDET